MGSQPSSASSAQSISSTYSSVANGEEVQTNQSANHIWHGPVDLDELDEECAEIVETNEIKSSARPSPDQQQGHLGLGDRVNDMNRIHPRILQKQMIVVTVILFACLAVVNGLVYVILQSFFDLNPSTTGDTGRLNTIRRVQKWYQKHATPFDATISPRTFREPVKQEKQCVDDWFLLVSQYNITHTSPYVINIIMDNDNTLLGEVPMIRYYLHDYLTEPVSLQMLIETQQCLKQSRSLASLACALHQRHSARLVNQEPLSRTEIEIALNTAAILERLTSRLLTDVATLDQVADLMLTKSGDSKNDSVLFSEAETLKLYANARSLSDKQKRTVKSGVQIDILESVATLYLDSQSDYENARVGLDIARGLTSEPILAQDPTRTMEYPVGGAWAEAHAAWQLNQIIKTDRDLMLQSAELLIPSVTCSVHKGILAESYIPTHMVSAALRTALKHESSIDLNPVFPLSSVTDNESIDQVVGIARVSPGAVMTLFDTLLDSSTTSNPEKSLTDSIWIANLDNDEFRVFYGFITWLTVLLAGFGFELLVLFGFLIGRRPWDANLERNWCMAQYAFPWLACATLGMAMKGNFMAVITLVPGLWKFGFPEVISYSHRAIFGGSAGVYNCRTGAPANKWKIMLARSVEFFNGLGTLVHHGAASFLIIMLLMGVITPNREVVTPILFLVMQHWFVLLAHVNTNLYVGLELILEAGFQWSVLSGLENLMADHWTAGISALTMLLAHEMYLVAATVELLVPDLNCEREDGDRRFEDCDPTEEDDLA